MHSLATKMLRQAAVAASSSTARRRLGGAAGAQWLAALHQDRPASCARRAPVLRITAIATPVRTPGLGASETAVQPWAAPVPASPSAVRGLAALWQAYLLSLERSPLLTKVNLGSGANGGQIVGAP